MSYLTTSWPFALDLARLAVLVLLMSKGGRYERALALMFIPMWLGEQVVLRLPDAWLAGPAIDLGFLVGHVWVIWRHRPPWLVAAALVLACKVTVGLGFTPVRDAPQEAAGVAVMVLAYVHLACLGWGVARQRLGPPAPVPAGLRPG